MFDEIRKQFSEKESEGKGQIKYGFVSYIMHEMKEEFLLMTRYKTQYAHHAFEESKRQDEKNHVMLNSINKNTCNFSGNAWSYYLCT